MSTAELAWAGTGDVVTRVACPALAADVKAEFEARAQVDLALRTSGGGVLDAACNGLVARLAWNPRAGGSFERTVSGSTPAALVDALLVAVAELATEAASSRPIPPAEAPKPVEEPKVAEDPNSERPPSPDRAAPSGSPQEGWSFPAGISLGGGFAFGLGGKGAAGPSVGFLLGLPAGFVASAIGSYGWALGTENQVSAQAAEGMLLLSYLFGPRRAFEVGAGASLGQISAQGPDNADPPSAHEIFVGGAARARYGWTFGGWRVAVGPEIRFNATPIQVEVDGAPAWELPWVTAGITADLAATLRGSLW